MQINTWSALKNPFADRIFTSKNRISGDSYLVSSDSAGNGCVFGKLTMPPNTGFTTRNNVEKFKKRKQNFKFSAINV